MDFAGLAAFGAEGWLEPEDALDLAVAVFSLILLSLSLNAYRRTGMRRLLLVSVAFGLFAVQVLVKYIDAAVMLGSTNDQILSTLLSFAILLCFFAALVSNR
jgi:Na+/glutamate symporter